MCFSSTKSSSLIHSDSVKVHFLTKLGCVQFFLYLYLFLCFDLKSSHHSFTRLLSSGKNLFYSYNRNCSTNSQKQKKYDTFVFIYFKNILKFKRKKLTQKYKPGVVDHSYNRNCSRKSQKQKKYGTFVFIYLKNMLKFKRKKF